MQARAIAGSAADASASHSAVESGQGQACVGRQQHSASLGRRDPEVMARARRSTNRQPKSCRVTYRRSVWEAGIDVLRADRWRLIDGEERWLRSREATRVAPPTCEQASRWDLTRSIRRKEQLKPFDAVIFHFESKNPIHPCGHSDAAHSTLRSCSHRVESGARTRNLFCEFRKILPGGRSQKPKFRKTIVVTTAVR